MMCWWVETWVCWKCWVPDVLMVVSVELLELHFEFVVLSMTGIDELIVVLGSGTVVRNCGTNTR